MPFTWKSSVISQAIVDLIQDNLAELELAAVYYGDPGLIPTYPAAVVESAIKNRDIEQTHQWEVNLTTTVIVYHGQVQSSEKTKKETEELIERVEDKIHTKLTLDGLVIFGFVSRVEPGFAVRDQVMLRASRLTWVGMSREVF